MTIYDAIKARHSVRAYKNQPLAEDVAVALKGKIAELNMVGNLHMQLIVHEPRAFLGTMARYGKFRGVQNYVVVAGQKSEDLDERAGYCGEHLVLFAQTLGLNSCWAGLSYSRIPGTYVLRKGEKIVCYIAIGYGETQGMSHKTKTIGQVSNVSDTTPSWFRNGVETALLAPTALNQQKFTFEYRGMKDGCPVVLAKRGISLFGYTKIDLGIAKCHFEIGAGKDRFNWM